MTLEQAEEIRQHLESAWLIAHDCNYASQFNYLVAMLEDAIGATVRAKELIREDKVV